MCAMALCKGLPAGSDQDARRRDAVCVAAEGMVIIKGGTEQGGFPRAECERKDEASRQLKINRLN